MAEFVLSCHPEQHVVYLRKEIFKILGPKPNAMTGQRAVILFSESAPLEDVLRSLQVIEANLAQAIQLQNKEKQEKN